MPVDEYNMMGLWRPWRWLDTIAEAVKKESAKPKLNVEFSTCAGELNVVSGRLTSLEQSVLQGTKRQVQGYNGLNSAQPRRPWGSTQTLLCEHNRVKHSCSDGHVAGIDVNPTHRYGSFARVFICLLCKHLTVKLQFVHTLCLYLTGFLHLVGV